MIHLLLQIPPVPIILTTGLALYLNARDRKRKIRAHGEGEK